MEQLFRRADILLPNSDINLTKWSVVACDQFTAQQAYWDTLEDETRDVPSTLHLMLPEAYLETQDPISAAERITKTMEDYLSAGLFREVRDSFIYLERTLSSGAVRRGLLGVLDLEAYDYHAGSRSPIRATEGTVESRLPPRVKIRQNASLEMPHIMVLVDDFNNRVIAPLGAQTDRLTKLYDFPLIAGGGHIRGWAVNGADADRVDAAMSALFDQDTANPEYGEHAPVIFAMGDGNHSFAAAKSFWEQLKPTLTETERKGHPARFCMVELVNIHDAAITFEPIHRALFETDPASFLREAREVFADRISTNGSHAIRLYTAKGEEQFCVAGLSIGKLIGTAEQFCQDYVKAHGGRVDYIHNDDAAIAMGKTQGQAALLLPRMKKSELFSSVICSGPFPKKSFSIGLAQDKRYYLECRKIKLL